MFEQKNFDHLLGTPGFSDTLLKCHFTLYQGYVINFNKLNDILVAIERDGKFGTPEYAELNRRLGWEFNGMRLHELYFGNMTKEEKALDPNSALGLAIAKEWGAPEIWKKDFISIGAMRGIGWAIMYLDGESGHLFNVWVNEHDVGHFAGCRPIIVMDVFEHAYILDYGIKKGDYIEAFFRAIGWQTAEERLTR
ncbi:MAG: Superoxide dismutase, Fe-Mn family [Candidatus Giovannonibacteria bacterium GW2011_GWC2_44_8]|nr:MAG: Superoxide dismutase, Fe-Mn family [Candidatus Giovannonibacteria bacterium GW2011_GWA2_44_26]KKT77543.1 MAG: Superoxide dismutase, Fe-Mn family [Candidatus Giovannonibacteria bacterium GW2011_GWC2_44_8]